MNRREFIGTLALSTALSAAQTPANVAISSAEPDPYQATLRAINSLPSSSFPDVNGKPVGLKVNLVVRKTASTGATTDPQVAAAVADYALGRGASHVYIVEAGQYSNGDPSGPPPFDLCGYTSLFGGRSNVSLIDLDNDQATVVSVPNGYVYQRISLPSTITQPGMVMISVAKLKTHVWSGITCATKNWFGLYTPPLYTGPWIARSGPHALGLAQSIVDMHLAVPCRFTVIDGMVGMMGNGPWNGIPITCNTVIAADNPIAADYVAMQVMGINKPIVHLLMAAAKGLGDGLNTQLWGDLPIRNNQFVLAKSSWPYASRPWVSGMNVAATAQQDCLGKLEIVKATDPQPPAASDVSVVRQLVPLTNLSARQQITATWDGLDDQGNTLAAGMYLARLGFVLAGADITNQRNFNYGSTFVTLA